MKEARNRMVRESSGTILKPGTTREPVDVTAIRREISQVVGEEAVRMVRRVMEGIDIRHYAAMKYLFEMAGLYPAAPQEETEDDDSLAKTLLCRLGLGETPLLESEVTKDHEMAAVATSGDAVE
ncbi:MAG: hypothetical protein LAN83_14645 [Acidobacteriia bacterium]|nr:hypothetical protein [Terriglobia bacterium]